MRGAQAWCLPSASLKKSRNSHLPMQGTWVQSLVWEEFTCPGATKLCTTTTEALGPTARAPQQKKPLQ